ncbi:hypothetical protein JZM30_18850 [Candidatus Symbiopectobacterium endolongispinus]|nr:hypothetical protein [Candidatus Symbiopectobacterium endolongispinus]
MKTVVDNETTPPDELPDAALAATEDVADSDAPTAQENAPTATGSCGWISPSALGAATASPHARIRCAI